MSSFGIVLLGLFFVALALGAIISCIAVIATYCNSKGREPDCERQLGSANIFETGPVVAPRSQTDSRVSAARSGSPGSSLDQPSQDYPSVGASISTNLPDIGIQPPPPGRG